MSAFFDECDARESAPESEWAAHRTVIERSVGKASNRRDLRRHLSARDLIHLACCRRRGVAEVLSFDRGLLAAIG